MSNNKIQRNKAFTQVCISLLFTIGAILIALGISTGGTISIISTFEETLKDEEDKKAIEIIMNNLKESSIWYLPAGGILIIIGVMIGIVVFIIMKD